MKKYEIMFIVRPDIEEADIKKTAEDMVKILEKDGAQNVTLKDMGQKELAYEVKKYKTGYYYLINLESKDSKATKEFDRLALISDNIIRHLIIKADE